MNDLEQIFERQAAWQRSRSNLPWAEKIRLSIVMRRSLVALRRLPKDCIMTTEDTPQRRRDVRAQ